MLSAASQSLSKKASASTSSCFARRAFGRTPMIQFLGPRSKLDKSVGAYASASHGSSAASAAIGNPNAKPLSRDCEVEFADMPAPRWARLAISELESEIINAGTNEVDVDWRSIRL